MMSRRLVVAILIAILPIGCSEGGSRRDAPLAWTFHRAWSVGGSGDQGGVSLSALQPFQVATDGIDRVYVLDRSEARVLVLGGNGELETAWGRKGEGPAEMVDPWGLWVARDGSVVVTDLGSRRLVRWEPNGMSLDPVRIMVHLDGPQVVLQDSTLWYTTVARSEENQHEYQLRSDGPDGTAIIARLERQPRRVANFPSCHAEDISVQPLFAPTIHWSWSGGRLAVNASDQYMIERIGPAGARDTVRRDIEPTPATTTLAEHEAADWLMNDCVVAVPEVVNGAGFMPTIPVVQDVLLAPEGELWVKRRGEPGGSDRIDVFAADRTYLGTLPLGTPFPLAFLGSARFVTVGKDSLDVPVVEAYDIERNGG